MWQDILQTDQQWLLALNGSWGEGFDTFFYYVSGKLTWIPLYLLILYGIWRKLGTRGLLWCILLLGLTVVVADQICNLFKTYTPKFRPSHTPAIEHQVHTVRGYVGGLYGTVSAHAATCFAIATFTTLLFKWWWYGIGLFLWAAMVAYSRIYLGVHFPLDLLFGTLLGITIGWIATRIRLKYIPSPTKQPR